MGSHRLKNVTYLMGLTTLNKFKITLNTSSKNMKLLQKNVLVHCNLVNNNYQQASKVLFNFVPNKQFGQLINITPHSLTMLKTTNAEFSFTEIWFTDQNNRSLEIEYNVNIKFIIGIS